MNERRISLDVVRVGKPCPQDWDAMTGDERTRFCAGCGLHVHNLSAMTRDEAERLVCERAARLCIRYEPTPTGGVRTLEYAGARRPVRSWRFWSLVGTLGAAVAGAAQLMVKGPAPVPPPPAAAATLGRPMLGVLMVVPSPSPGAEGDEAVAPVFGEVHAPEPDAPAQPVGPPAPEDQAFVATPR